MCPAHCITGDRLFMTNLDPRQAAARAAENVCDRCGNPKSRHNDVQLFCPFYSTYRERKPAADAVGEPSEDVQAAAVNAGILALYRLRDQNADTGPRPIAAAVIDAATPILRAAQAQEVARLEQENKIMHEAFAHQHTEWAALRQRLERLQAMNFLLLTESDAEEQADHERAVELESLRHQLAEEHGLPGWWPLSNDDMPDREWTNIEHLRNQLWLANDAAAQTEQQLAEAREALRAVQAECRRHDVSPERLLAVVDGRVTAALRALGGPRE